LARRSLSSHYVLLPSGGAPCSSVLRGRDFVLMSLLLIIFIIVRLSIESGENLLNSPLHPSTSRCVMFIFVLDGCGVLCYLSLQLAPPGQTPPGLVVVLCFVASAHFMKQTFGPLYIYIATTPKI
jgi:hypothetical protein